MKVKSKSVFLAAFSCSLLTYLRGLICNLLSAFLCFVSWLAILILLAYMAMVVVILLNVLIAQLSYTYSEAKRNAKLQYAIDRMRIVTRLEHSRFARFVSVVIV